MLWWMMAAALADDPALERRVDKVLAKTPLIDGHNDVPWAVRSRVALQIEKLGFDGDTSQLDPPMHTDISRLRAGKAGGVFWSVWVPDTLETNEAVRVTMEQMDVVHQMCHLYEDLTCVHTAAEARKAFKSGAIASFIGMEGGHSIGNSLGALRILYEAGARYMTLTHWHTNDWADSATSPPIHGGLSPFGESVVSEMNRIGMLVDLSHVSEETMLDALRVSKAPVIFSHSGARAINAHPRNVPDEVLDQVKMNGGVVMVDFLPTYVSADVHEHRGERAAAKGRIESMMLGATEAQQEEALKAWETEHPSPRTTVSQVADHVDHIRARIGAEHIGIGSDFDGMRDQPDGLDDASKTPALLVELAKRGYSDKELAGIAGENVLRALEDAEAVAKKLSASTPPSNALHPTVSEQLEAP